MSAITYLALSLTKVFWKHEHPDGHRTLDNGLLQLLIFLYSWLDCRPGNVWWGTPSTGQELPACSMATYRIDCVRCKFPQLLTSYLYCPTKKVPLTACNTCPLKSAPPIHKFYLYIRSHKTRLSVTARRNKEWQIEKFWGENKVTTSACRPTERLSGKFGKLRLVTCELKHWSALMRTFCIFQLWKHGEDWPEHVPQKGRYWEVYKLPLIIAMDSDSIFLVGNCLVIIILFAIQVFLFNIENLDTSDHKRAGKGS